MVETLEKTTLPDLFDVLKEKYGEKWFDLEPETISMDLGLEFSPLFYDKLQVLRLMCAFPTMYLNDVAFMAYATRVINDDTVEPEIFPEVNSLELAYGLVIDATLRSRLGVNVDQAADGVQEFCKHVLVHDGYGQRIPPFSGVISDSVWGEDHQTAAGDLEGKKKAVTTYLKEKLHAKS